MLKCLKNEKLWFAVGGAAAMVIGKKIVKAKKTRELAVCGLAKGMKLQSDAKVEAGIEKAPVEETTDENSEEME